MKKNFLLASSKIALIGVVASLSLGSCGKKDNEPTKPKTDNPAGESEDPSKPAEPTNPDKQEGDKPTEGTSNPPATGDNQQGNSQTDNNTETPSTSGITIGITPKAGVSQISFIAEGEGLKLNSETLSSGVERTINLASHAKLEIEGTLTALTITQGDLELLDLSKAIPSLTSLKTKVSLGAIKLDGAKNLSLLELDGFAPLSTLDLSTLSKLESLTLGKSENSATNGTLTSVSFPKENNITLLHLDNSGYFDANLNQFGKLQRLVVRNKSLGSSLKLQGHPSLKKLHVVSPAKLTSIIIDQCAELDSITSLYHLPDNLGETPIEVAITNNPKLLGIKDFAHGKQEDKSSAGNDDDTNEEAGEYVRPDDTKTFPKGLSNIKISGNPKLLRLLHSPGITDQSYFKSQHLKSIDISHSVLRPGILDFVLKSLHNQGKPETHTIKLTGVNISEDQKTALEIKQWRVIQ